MPVLTAQLETLKGSVRTSNYSKTTSGAGLLSELELHVSPQTDDMGKENVRVSFFQQEPHQCKALNVGFVFVELEGIL